MKPFFSRIMFLAVIAGITIISSSFQSHPVPFKGKVNLDLSNGVVGTGTATTIGKFILVADDDETGFPYITGIVTITAANGDEIFITHTGMATDLGDGILQIEFENTITGGTGRFAGASGSFQMHSTADTNAGTAVARFDGTISY